MSTAVAATIHPAAQAGEPIRVMVVDDAVVVRGLVSRWVDSEPDMKIVASLRTGRDAVDQVVRIDPEVVVLDIEMPVLDGISALPLLLERKRDLVVIMASTLTRRNAEVSLKALSLGAADYVPKPETNHEVTTSATFRRDLIEKIRQLGMRRRRRSAPPRGPMPGAPVAGGETHRMSDVAGPGSPNTALKLRPFSLVPPRVLLIGSSTGGPQALTALIGRLASVIDRAPILITQHMPPTFTTILAEHLARASGRPAREPAQGDPVLAGNVYVAPGGRHMSVVKRDANVRIALDDGPLVNFCKPAVDPLFTSAAAIWGASNLAVILTGMGSDGALGAAKLVAAGGSVIAQDEATSVVWGMPGAAAQAGVCAAVLPLDQIAPKVVRLFHGDSP